MQCFWKDLKQLYKIIVLLFLFFLFFVLPGLYYSVVLATNDQIPHILNVLISKGGIYLSKCKHEA